MPILETIHNNSHVEKYKAIFNGNIESTSTDTGTLVVGGGAGIGGNLNISGIIKSNKINPGLLFNNINATSSPKVSIRSPINFKVIDEIDLFTVPFGGMFLIDSMEIITTDITSPGTPPTIRLGNSNDASEYYIPTQTTSNSFGARHIIENPMNGISAGVNVTCGVTIASTASSHNGFVKIVGELLYPNSIITNNIIPPIYSSIKNLQDNGNTGNPLQCDEENNTLCPGTAWNPNGTCVPYSNWFCCPDNLYVAPTAMDCPGFHLFDKSSWSSTVPQPYLTALNSAADRWNALIIYDPDNYYDIKNDYAIFDNENWNGLKLSEVEIFNEEGGPIAACGPRVVFNIDGSGKKLTSSEFVLLINTYYENTFTQEDWMNVLTHELGHALGIGIFWDERIVGKFGGTPPTETYLGPYLDGTEYTEAQGAYNLISSLGHNKIPLEDTGGSGTRLVHWEDNGRKAISSPYLWGFGDSSFVENPAREFRSIVYSDHTKVENIEQIYTSDTHQAILKNNGNLYIWGINNYGQVGNNQINEFIGYSDAYHAGCDYKEISINFGTSYAIKNNGDLYAWGSNVGSLGDGTNQEYNLTPTFIGSGYSKISAGGFGAIALKNNGDLYAWGLNNMSQLGDGTNIGKNIPTFIGSGYSKISAGGQHSLALKNNGDLYAWGWNMDGQLGDNTNVDKNTPTLIGSGYSDISAGDVHSLALKTNGDLYAWGYNDYGQLGDGSWVTKKIPTFIGSSYSEINAGTSRSSGLKTNGDLYAWGYNNDNNLGVGNNIDRNTPTKIQGQSYTKISKGISYLSFAISTENFPEINLKYLGLGNEILTPYFYSGLDLVISSLSTKCLVDFGYIERIPGYSEGSPILSNTWNDYTIDSDLDTDLDSDCIGSQSIQTSSLIPVEGIKFKCGGINLKSPIIRQICKD